MEAMEQEVLAKLGAITPRELAACTRLAANQAAEIAQKAADTAWGTFQADMAARQASLYAKAHSDQMKGLALAAEAASDAAAAATAAAEAAADTAASIADLPDRTVSASSARPSRSAEPRRRRRSRSRSAGPRRRRRKRSRSGHRRR
jgi:hypothetical protein